MIQPERKKLEISEGQPWFTWILANYTDFATGKKTPTGRLISAAKYKGDLAASKKLISIVDTVISRPFILRDGRAGLQKVTAVVAVPSLPAKLISVPHRISAGIAKQLEVDEVSNLVCKVRPTDKAKFGSALDPSAYEVDGDLSGHTVLIVDDVFKSGNTLESLAIQLRAANADVIGFCLAKAVHGMKVN
jgi:predicted amidophosphoribosyltransferase